MSVFVVSPFVMLINSGLSKILSARSLIGFGIVAEKRSVCLFDGRYEKISLISSKNPISSISSASSRTTILGAKFFKRFFLSISKSLPGVATTTLAPLSIRSICLL
jgi:hypothetical protein